MKKEHNRSWWKKEADRWFSKYIRERDKNKGCYTCGTSSPKLQCGHFVPRQYLATRYSEINNHAQCYACNMLFNGQPSAYAERLKKDYGNDIVASLEGMRKTIIRDMNYEEIAHEYQIKYESLVGEFDTL